MKMKKIVLTGGGTAGHVTPNLALVPALEKQGFKISYIGSKNGIEKELVKARNIDYYSISTGKLRRYFDLKNFTDCFRVVKGFADAVVILKKLKPDVVFSKGGFVSVPVVLAAKFLSIPSVIHESDISPGLANKICIPNAKAVCASFPEALKNIPEQKAVLTGSPIRQALFKGKREKGLEICSFNSNKPVLLVMGGSLGAVHINEILRESVFELTDRFQIIHICGKGNLNADFDGIKGYKQTEYVSSELADIFACCDIIVSRAGSNSIFEFLALKKPPLLIPLPKEVSRGDQILNAYSFKKQGFADVLEEKDMTKSVFIKKVNELYDNREQYIKTMKQTNLANGVEEVMIQINKVIAEKK
jgi:UDP-N-acetylglucosamine--N-acetylmuramyl-(pentapeptide) pyrophosphoryl-undecaprenol N-acetylglucosamine transferase